MYADKIFINGRVITADANNQIAEAVAINGKKILRVGKNEDIEKLTDTNTQRIDLAGKPLLPGFIDAHSHMIVYGMYLDQIDCSFPSVSAIDDILIRVKERAQKSKKGEWIQGWGYDEFSLKEQRYPTRWELDRAAPENPVVLMRTCIHACVANSLAMQEAGIDKHTVNPDGGEIVKDPSTGEPTGLLREMPAMDLIQAAMPPADIDTLRKAIKRASDVYIKEGITSTHDAGIGSINPLDIRAYQDVCEQDPIPVRVYLTLREYTYRRLGIDEGGLGLYTGFGNTGLKIGPVKWILDGGIGAKTAAMKAPYTDGSSNRGFLIISKEDLLQSMEKVHRNKFQISIHAIGDNAIETALDCFEIILNRSPRKNHRHRIEHFTCATPRLIKKASQLGIQAIVQPTMLNRLGESFIQNLNDRTSCLKPCRSFIEAGLRPAGSSDRPVVPGNPLLGIYSAVTRKTDKGHIISPDEQISVMDAIRMYTINGAYASFEEKIKGSIEADKLADLIVLSQDPLSVERDTIKDIHVEMTMVGGKIVYTSKVFNNI